MFLIDKFTHLKVQVRQHILSLGMALLAFASVVLTLNDYGHTWDEALYYQGAKSSAKWVSQLLSGDLTMLSQRSVEQYWGSHFDGIDYLRPEVAPFPKLITGIGELLSSKPEQTMFSMRLPVVLLFSLTIYLLALYGQKSFHSIMPAILYLLMPRVFGHAHLAASETISVFFALLFYLYCQNSPLSTKRHLIMLGILLGFLFLTKITLIIFVIPMVYIMLVRHQARIPALLLVLIAFICTIYILWPNFWHEPISQISEYLRFYSAHQRTTVFYMGQKWGYTFGSPAPWHYPLVILFVCLPIWHIGLLVFTLCFVLAKFRHYRQSRLAPLVLFAVLPICPLLLPWAPKYDGERLFFTSFVFIALIAGGYGWHFLTKCFGKFFPVSSRHCNALASMLALCLFLPLQVHHAAFHIDYYNLAIGGHKGAKSLGFETTYWGQTVNSDFCAQLNEALPLNSTIIPLAMERLALQNLQSWGYLRQDFAFSTQQSSVNPDNVYYLVQMREGFLGNFEQRLIFGKVPPVCQETSADGTCFLALYPKPN